MESHRDDDANSEQVRRLIDGLTRTKPSLDMGRLEERAADVVSKGESQITAGVPGEFALLEREVRGVHVRQLPDDEQGIVRVSVGGVTGEFVYCTFRGKVGSARAMLSAALRALEKV